MSQNLPGYGLEMRVLSSTQTCEAYLLGGAFCRLGDSELRALGPQLRKPLDTESGHADHFQTHRLLLKSADLCSFNPAPVTKNTGPDTGKTPAGPHVDENGFLKQI